MKTLLYLAAGPYLDAYAHLAFDKLIFVEKDNRYWAKSYGNISLNAEWIANDALIAIDELKSRGIKIDYLVSLNEGLNDGGGGYAILSDEVMGYLSPILKDEFVLICDFSHYPLEVRDYYACLDWGFKKIKELKNGDSGFVDPKIFTESQEYNSGSYGHVFKMKRINRSARLSIANQNVKVRVVHGSIWENEANLDTIGLSFNPSKLVGNAAYNSQSISDFLESKPKVLNLRNKSFDDVLGFCDRYKIKHLGLCPWLNGNYKGVIERLQGDMPQSLEQISFYHLNKGDFQEFYR
jgi:hypothetical protein